MILLESTLKGAPVMGLQTGSEIARITEPVIDPATLAILAYGIESPSHSDGPWLLRIADVREMSDIGLIIDSEDEFVQPQDVIKLNDIYNLKFHVIGKTVTDQKRRKLGKVIDFTLETGNFIIQQLTVRRPIFKSLNDTELLIHRSQIIEINDEAIVVHSEAKVPEKELHEVVGSYVNPFRKQKATAPESIDPTRPRSS